MPTKLMYGKSNLLDFHVDAVKTIQNVCFFTLFTANIHLVLPWFTHKNHDLHLHIGNSTTNIYVISRKWQKNTIFNGKIGKFHQKHDFIRKNHIFGQNWSKSSQNGRFPQYMAVRKKYVFQYAFLRVYTAKIRALYGSICWYVFSTYFVRIKYVFHPKVKSHL